MEKECSCFRVEIITKPFLCQSLVLKIPLTATLTLHLMVVGLPGVTSVAVNCSSTDICAFRGSTVDISCTHSILESPQKTFWTREDADVDLSSNSLQSYRCTQKATENTNGYRYYKTTLRIQNVSKNDSATYRIRIRTSDKVWGSGDPGVRLTVSGNSQHVS